MKEEINSNFGGCTCKLDPDILNRVLKNIPKKFDENLLIGFESKDDAAIYKLTDDIALVETLDFFTRIVDDPYTFGKIAAVNALNDIYAMGGEVKLALSIVCFPEKEDPKVLEEILRGGSEKVIEAGGVLCGGHSINDSEIKFGLSVTGIINPKKIIQNNNCKIGDKLILTKPLGVGIVTTAYKMGEASEESYNEAILQMETLNKYAKEKAMKYNVHALTDVTGFGFLGHLDEMVTDEYSVNINSKDILYIKNTLEYAKEFFITAGGQKNRNFLKNKIVFGEVPFEVQEALLDPQTAGGLLISLPSDEAETLLKDLEELQIKSSIVGEVVNRKDSDIYIF